MPTVTLSFKISLQTVIVPSFLLKNMRFKGLLTGFDTPSKMFLEVLQSDPDDHLCQLAYHQPNIGMPVAPSLGLSCLYQFLHLHLLSFLFVLHINLTQSSDSFEYVISNQSFSKN
jgi:hypothetical protein